MTTFIDDDFETGAIDAAWTGTSTNNTTCNADVNTDAVINGSYGLDCDAASAANNHYEYHYYNWAPEDNTNKKLVVEFEFEWDAWTSGGFNLATSRGPFSVYRTEGFADQVFWWALTGTRQLTFYGRDGDGGDNSLGSYTFTLATVYTVKAVWDWSGTDPTLEWWVEGTSQGSFTDTSTGTRALNYPDQGNNADHCEIRCGVVFNGTWESGTYTWFVDDVWVADADRAAAAAGAVLPPNRLMKAMYRRAYG